MDERDDVGGPMPAADGPAYDVGYAKPPASTRFKRGQSGNPKGRPKGSRKKQSLNDVLQKMLLETRRVKESGVYKEMPIMEILMQQTINSAVNGDKKSRASVFDMWRKADLDERQRMLAKQAQEERPAGGVLLIPASPATEEEWLRQAAAARLPGWEDDLNPPAPATKTALGSTADYDHLRNPQKWPEPPTRHLKRR